MKKNNKKHNTNNKKKTYSSSNSKYVQQAQKLVSQEDKKSTSVKSEQVKSNPQVKTTNKANKSTPRSQNYQAKKHNANKKVQDTKKVQEPKKAQVNKVESNQSAKPVVKEEKQTNVNKVNKTVNKKNQQNVKQVKTEKSKIKEELPKLDYVKVQEEAKKKSLELIEELKQQKNIKDKPKEEVKEEPKQVVKEQNKEKVQAKTVSGKSGAKVAKAKSVLKKQEPVTKKVESKKDSSKYNFNDIKEEVVNKELENKKEEAKVISKEPLKKQPVKKEKEEHKKPQVKRDELLEKLQEELDKKDKQIISGLDLSPIDERELGDTQPILKVEDEDDAPTITKIDLGLKDLIKKEEKEEKAEKKTTSKEKVSKVKKEKKTSKLGKLSSVLAVLAFIFYVIASGFLVYKIHQLDMLPMKYIYMLIGGFAAIAFIIFGTNVTVSKFKVLKAIQMAISFVIGIGLIYLCIRIYKPEKLMKIASIACGVIGGFSILMALLSLTKSKIMNIVRILVSCALGVAFIFVGMKVHDINETLKGMLVPTEEKATYYVLVLKDSKYTKLDELKGLNVGILNQNKDNVQEYLKDYNFKYMVDYNIAKFEDMMKSKKVDEKLDAIIIDMSLYDQLEELDKDFYALLKKIDEFEVLRSQDIEEEPDVEIQVGDDEKVEPPSAPKRNPDLLNGVNTKNSYVILINGVDGRNDSKPYGLSDVNMLAVINPDTHKVLLVSVPRDYFVRVPGTTPGMRDKLSHSGIYGINATIGAMEGIFGIDINDYLQFGFNAVPITVDSVGGIDVYSDTEFDSYHMKGWHVPKGWIHLNGKQALAYSRERYAYINQGDKHRVKNQQDVIQAIIKKVVTDPAQLAKFDTILSQIDPYLNTNISYDKMRGMVKQQLNTLTPWTVEKISVDGYDGYQVTASYPKDKAYVMYPYESSIIKAQEKILDVMTGK